jgi:outer membrane biosynthesis protein TonB
MRPLLGACADKELDATQAGRVEQHLATCADCRRELAQIEQLHKLVKSVPHPELAEDYWHWQQNRVWRRINHDRRGLARPLRQPLLSGRFVGMAAGLVVVAVVVIAGWRMLGQGSLIDVGRYLMTEKTAGTRPEAVAALPKKAGAEAQADNREPEAGRSADEIAAGKAVEAQGKGLMEVSRGGSVGGAGAAGREPVVVTLQDRGEGMAGAGYKDKEEVGKPAQRQDNAVEQPAQSGAGAEATPSAASPVTAEEGSSLRLAQAAKAELTPELLSAPALPEVGEADTGTAVLKITTDSLGFVTRAVVMRSSGRALNDSIAALNARASRFKPVLREGRPLGSVFQRQYRFKVAEKSEQKQDKPEQGKPDKNGQ